MADQRILQAVAATLSVTMTDQNGVAAAASGAVTVGATKADGSTLIAAGTATGGTNPYTKTLTAAQTASLDILTATWTDAGDGSVNTTTAEIVGGYYVTVAEMRALKNLDNTSTFPDAKLIAARQWFEDAFERYTAVAWVPRYTRVRVDGNYSTTLLLPYQRVRTVRSVRTYSDATTYTAFSAAELADLHYRDWGAVQRGTLGHFTAGTANVVIELEHGYDEPPTDVKQAALVAIRDYLLTDNTGNRVFGVQTQDGIIRSSAPGPDRPFGIPFVDEVAVSRSHKVPAVA